MAYAILDLTIATLVKARIWNGEKQDLIGTEFSISQATISHIVTGRRYHDAQWPDGTVGALSSARKKELRVILYSGVRGDIARTQRPTADQIMGAALAVMAGDVDLDSIMESSPHTGRKLIKAARKKA